MQLITPGTPKDAAFMLKSKVIDKININLHQETDESNCDFSNTFLVLDKFLPCVLQASSVSNHKSEEKLNTYKVQTKLVRVTSLEGKISPC